MFQVAAPRALLLPVVVLLGLGGVVSPAAAHGGRYGGDRLAVTVSHAGSADGTHLLRCHPGGGDHPDPSGACRVLDRRTRWGRDPFAAEEPHGLCTMQYGGPAVARVIGTWAGRPVDVTYDRHDGCAVSRWDALVPVLPGLGQ
ncbi:Subtilisin inhibitor [Actinobacteria bacterium OK074]|nr:Subtilisin inhibitor [Actinobacteria bacterium OK074]